MPTKLEIENMRRAKLGLAAKLDVFNPVLGEEVKGFRPVAGYATVDDPTCGCENDIDDDDDNWDDWQASDDDDTDIDEEDFTDFEAEDREIGEDNSEEFDAKEFESAVERTTDILNGATSGYDTYLEIAGREDGQDRVLNDDEFESLSGFINFMYENGWDGTEHSQFPVFSDAMGLWDEYDELGGPNGTKRGPPPIGASSGSRVSPEDLTRSGVQKISNGLRSGKAEGRDQEHPAFNSIPSLKASPAVTTPAGVEPAANSKNTYAANANPKDALGIQKVSLGYIPGPAKVYMALGFQNGGVKYGNYNWREHKVLASVYTDAIERHVAKIIDGEWIDPESGIPHLSHLLASGGILADAYEAGCLINDLPSSGPTPRLLDYWNGELKTKLIPMWVAEREARKAKK